LIFSRFTALIDRQIFAVHWADFPPLKFPVVELVEECSRQDEIPSSVKREIIAGRIQSGAQGYLFGENEFAKFNHLNKLRLITRSHELAMGGISLVFPRILKDHHRRGKIGDYLGNECNSDEICFFPGQEAFDLRVFTTKSTEN
jgi:hypothetical protein